MLTIYTAENDTLHTMDAGIIPSGTSKEIHLKVVNPDSHPYTNITIRVYDYNSDGTGRSAKSVVLGGNGISPNHNKSFVFASNDGNTWMRIAGDHAYLSVVPLGDIIDNGEAIDFYLKIEIPEGKILNMQKFNIAVFGTTTSAIE